jgi:hypothetical protein
MLRKSYDRLFKHINIKVRNKPANFSYKHWYVFEQPCIIITVTFQYNIHVQWYVYSVHKTTMLFLVDQKYLGDIYIGTTLIRNLGV